jgi:ribosomal subunit interface protein
VITDVIWNFQSIFVNPAPMPHDVRILQFPEVIAVPDSLTPDAEPRHSKKFRETYPQINYDHKPLPQSPYCSPASHGSSRARRVRPRSLRYLTPCFSQRESVPAVQLLEPLGERRRPLAESRTGTITHFMNQNTMTTLQIHITPDHLNLCPPLRDFVCMKFEKVHRIASDAVAADIVLRRQHGTSSGPRFSVSARLAVPGRDIHASATHADLHPAVVKLVAMIARRSRKRKARLARTYRPRRAGRAH